MLRIQQILVAHDQTTSSEAALRYAAVIAEQFGAHLHLVFVDIPQGVSFESGPEAVRLNDLQESLRRVAESALTSHGGRRRIHASPIVVQDSAVAPAILGTADELRVDLIVMGTHGHRGLQRALLGSVAEEVVRRATCAVLTVGPNNPEPAMRDARLLVPVDFSIHAQQAVAYAKAMAAQLGAHVHLLHVAETPYHSPLENLLKRPAADPTQEAQAQLRALYEEAPGPASSRVSFEVRTGLIGYEINATAEESAANLIVMATHGMTGLRHVIAGSVAERVVRTAPCPVFTIKSFGRSLLDASEEQGA